MKATKILLMLITAISSVVMSQQIKNISIKNARIIEANKKEFIGKPLSYLLSKIDQKTIKSVLPMPNKDKKSINRLVFRPVTYNEYVKYMGVEIKDRPVQIIIVFNQNFNLEGKICNPIDLKCIDWTKEDEQNLGDLIVYDVYVLGKD